MNNKVLKGFAKIAIAGGCAIVIAMLLGAMAKVAVIYLADEPRFGVVEHEGCYSYRDKDWVADECFPTIMVAAEELVEYRERILRKEKHQAIKWSRIEKTNQF